MTWVTYHLFLSVSCGGSAFGILNSTLMGCMAWYGGCISASSISVTPADQMSACSRVQNRRLIFQETCNHIQLVGTFKTNRLMNDDDDTIGVDDDDN